MKYEELRKKHKEIPSLKWLKNNFEIEGNEVSDVMKSVYSMLKRISTYFESLLLGESYKTFVERTFLTEKEKEELSKMYRELQILINKELMACIAMDEKLKAKWFAEAKDFWEKRKGRIIEILEKICNSWKKRKTKIERETKYHW